MPWQEQLLLSLKGDVEFLLCRFSLQLELCVPNCVSRAEQVEGTHGFS